MFSENQKAKHRACWKLRQKKMREINILAEVFNCLEYCFFGVNIIVIYDRNIEKLPMIRFVLSILFMSPRINY